MLKGCQTYSSIVFDTSKLILFPMCSPHSNDVEMKAHWRRSDGHIIDVSTSHQRHLDVITTSCACWFLFFSTYALFNAFSFSLCSFVRKKCTPFPKDLFFLDKIVSVGKNYTMQHKLLNRYWQTNRIKLTNINQLQVRDRAWFVRLYGEIIPQL